MRFVYFVYVRVTLTLLLQYTTFSCSSIDTFPREFFIFRALFMTLSYQSCWLETIRNVWFFERFKRNCRKAPKIGFLSKSSKNWNLSKS